MTLLEDVLEHTLKRHKIIILKAVGVGIAYSVIVNVLSMAFNLDILTHINGFILGIITGVIVSIEDFFNKSTK